jgi:hypothetical protein
MPPHIALANTRRNLRPHGIAVEPMRDNRFKVRSTRNREAPVRFCHCPDMAYIVGLRLAKEAHV